MINVYFAQGVVSKVVWDIMKGSSGVPEDFSRATVKVWLISHDDKIVVESQVVGNKIVVPLSAIQPQLPANVYSMKAMWYKDGKMERMSVAEVYNAFAVTNISDEATPYPGDELTIHIKSPAATYGRDGLSAYEIACMRGTTTALSEKEWVQIRATEIEENQIADGAITTPKIADGAVTTGKIDNGNVTTAKLADGAVTTNKIREEAVTTNKIPDGAITGDKLAPNAITEDKLAPQTIPDLRQMYADLYDRVGNLEKAYQEPDGKIVIDNELGDSRLVTVSQKTLTDAINKIWQKLEDITGEVLQGIDMVVTPNYFISEDGCDIHIAANTVETNGIFEQIQFFINGEKIYDETNKEYVSFDYHLDNKSEYDYVVMCKAKILGIEYTRQKIVNKYNEFFIGAGDTYADVMNSAHARQLNGTMRHNYDVTFDEGDKLVIVMGASLRPAFIRAYLNGAEIEMTEETVIIDGKDYVVFTSDAWSAGDYNIDING